MMSHIGFREALILLARHFWCSAVGHRWVEGSGDLPIFDVPFYVCTRCLKFQRVVNLADR
jgi:hypothetical protein